MHDEVDAVLRVERLAKRRRQVVRHVLDDLVHPLHGGDHRASLRLPQHRGALASQHLRVRNQAHHQRVAARLRLPQRVGVAEVREVEAPVHVHADRLPPRASGPKRASGGLQQSGDATGCGDHGACSDHRHRRERRGEPPLPPSRRRHRAPSCGARPHVSGSCTFGTRRNEASDIRERSDVLVERIRGKRGVVDYWYGLLSFRTRRARHYATLLFLTL